LSLDEGVSRFIGRLYESVYDPDAWRSAMDELMKRTGSRLAFISYADVRNREYSRTEFYGPDNSQFARGKVEYGEEFYLEDPSLLWASEHPQAGMCDTSRLMADDEFRKLPYVVWQESRFKTVHWRVFYTQPVDDLSFALSLHPPGTAGPTSKEDASLHKLLFEHMELSLRLAARPPDLAASGEVLIILDTAGQVLSMSPRAEDLAAKGDGFRIERRRLLPTFPAAGPRFDTAIASAVMSGSLGGAGGGVRLPRPYGRPDWLALVSPCPKHLDHLPVPMPAAVLRIVETDSSANLTAAHAELFDLTAREIHIADALLRGHSLESLCHALDISRNTAKAHLQSLFRKTGTNRQSELVHLLSNITRA
jgi:DNA-binding CsgD family transcriptional regulator